MASNKEKVEVRMFLDITTEDECAERDGRRWLPNDTRNAAGEELGTCDRPLAPKEDTSSGSAE